MKQTDLSYWEKLIGHPEAGYIYPTSIIHKQDYEYPDFTCEYYLQQNGPDTFQRVMMLIPKHKSSLLPAIAVPFYFPEAMLGEEPDTHIPLPRYHGVEIMLHLVKRGYITISAEAYHLTYATELQLDRDDFNRWSESAAKLNAEHPHWSGVGKLVADTKLLIDMLYRDARVDNRRLGIAGHSLGGKMAFYTGCLDSRISAILASDFGIRWEQTNWDDAWYWGKERISSFLAEDINHDSLIQASGNKPFALIAGQYDNDDSLKMLQQAGYSENSDKLCFINHATGHRPPQWALEKAYDFIDYHLQNKTAVK